MTVTNITPATPPLTVADIRWALDPLEPEPADGSSRDGFLDDIVDLTIERNAYRLLTKQLLEHLHHVTLERDVLREQRRRDRQQESRRKVAA